MGDLTTYARGVATGLTSRWLARRAAKKLAAAKLIEFAQDLERQADDMAEMTRRLTDSYEEIDKLHDKVRRTRELDKRIDMAIDEMKGGKAVAIIVSPSQYNNGSFYGRRKEYKGLPILIATGISGPLVVTRDGLDGLTRQAPELTIRTA